MLSLNMHPSRDVQRSKTKRSLLHCIVVSRLARKQGDISCSINLGPVRRCQPVGRGLAGLAGLANPRSAASRRLASPAQSDCQTVRLHRSHMMVLPLFLLPS